MVRLLYTFMCIHLILKLLTSVRYQGTTGGETDDLRNEPKALFPHVLHIHSWLMLSIWKSVAFLRLHVGLHENVYSLFRHTSYGYGYVCIYKLSKD
jgi:hypothetical protein